jgi:uncharacterized membrane protein
MVMVTSFLRNKHRSYDPVWHVQVLMAGAVVLQFLLPSAFVAGSRYLIAIVGVLLLIALGLTTPREKVYKSRGRRLNVILLIALSGANNIFALSRVVHQLLAKTKVSDGRQLILAAVAIYLTNIIIFGLLYWELDGGGPGERLQTKKPDQDFMFPQNQNEDYKHPQWRPTFIDYLYISSTNAMAFSPTDTMPLSRRAKMIMLLQATISLIVVALVAARAVNILG